jgi:hypothetical protein
LLLLEVNVNLPVERRDRHAQRFGGFAYRYIPPRRTSPKHPAEAFPKPTGSSTKRHPKVPF